MNVRGARTLARLERPFLLLDSLLRPALPVELNPIAQAGALANAMLIVACLTGVVLLIWYRSSVHQAYGSLEDLDAAGALMRSLHRYSSDACVLFATLHGLRMLFAGRLVGPRWLAWVTGVFLMSTLWFVGWLGYWLVWDERGQQVALGTAKLLDDLPLFAEPLSRSFLTDESINSLLFFMVFFVHMLVPLVMGVAVWMHILRLNRARFLPARPLVMTSLAALAIVSLIHPATSAAPARMAEIPAAFTFDAWYLLPLALTDRLSGGALWALLLVSGAFLYGLPRLLRKGPSDAAAVTESRCNACETCVRDCPYTAIRLVPRTDGKPGVAVRALVDPAKCVECGICAGACDAGAIQLPGRVVVDLRHDLDRRLAERPGAFVAFACTRAASTAALEGYEVVTVPCAGEVHGLTVARALRHGAAGVIVVACPEESCEHREGTRTAAGRLSGVRKPALDPAVASGQVEILTFARGQENRLRAAAETFRQGARPGTVTPRPWRRHLVIVACGAVLSALTLLGSDLPYHTGARETPELWVSFNHPGQSGERCRDLSPEEIAQQPVHMRRTRICERGRAHVRLEVRLDGAVVQQRSYAPSGLAGDGNSVAIDHHVVAPGSHEVEVRVGDGPDPAVYEHVERRTLIFAPRHRRVVLFDKAAGFTWR